MKAFFFVSLSLLAQSAAAADFSAKYALLIGVATHKVADVNKPPREFSEVDAKGLAEIFKSSGYTVDLLVAKQATRAAIQTKLSDLKNKASAEGVVVIGLFGHGLEFESTGTSCYCPFDATVRNVVDSKGQQLLGDDGKAIVEPDPDSLIALSDFMSVLRQSPARNRVLLADCCCSCADPSRSRAFGQNMTPTDLPENTAVLFACSANEQPVEQTAWKHGAFTRCLIDEMKSQPATGRVTAQKLADELQLKVKRLVATAMDGKNQTTRSILTNNVDFQWTIAALDRRSTPLNATRPSNVPTSKIDRSFEGTKAGERRELVPGMFFRWCPAGTFMMGSPKSEPDRNSDEDQVEVTLSSGFWLLETAVTQSHWRKVMRTKPWHGKLCVKEGDNFPATYLSWDDAVEFCNRLTTQERAPGRLPKSWKYSLPTEAQWEYACRANTTTRFSFGENEAALDTYAWFGKNSWDVGEKYAHQVGQKAENPWGLHDIHGNIFEWCSDWYGTKLPGGQDPSGAPSGSVRVARGGNYITHAAYSRSAYRRSRSPDARDDYLGFRLAIVPSSQ